VCQSKKFFPNSKKQAFFTMFIENKEFSTQKSAAKRYSGAQKKAAPIRMVSMLNS